MTVTSGKSAQRSGVVAICGNPNCGKTTIFNAITGLSQQVGNYPGVTVEKVSGRFESPENPEQKFTLIDIPGSYSLSAFTPDEYIAARVLFGIYAPDIVRAPQACPALRKWPCSTARLSASSARSTRAGCN